MTRLRLVYLASLLVTGVVAVVVALPAVLSFQPGDAQQGGPVQMSSLLERDDEWVFQIELTNPTKADVNQTVRFDVDGQVYDSQVSLAPGGSMIYIRHVYPEQLTEGRVTVFIVQEGTTTPVEQATYYLRRRS